MAPAIPEIPDHINLTGNAVLVTGVTAGIGFEVARQFLQLGASEVFFVVRSLEKGKQAKKDLLDDPIVKQKNPDAAIKIYEADLASFESIKRFSATFSQEVKQLNIAVLNAGVSFLKYVETADKNEMNFQVNYLSNVLLASYLVPILKAGAASSGNPSHLSLVSSQMQHMTKFGSKTNLAEEGNVIEWFNDKKNMSMDRYNATKLLVTAYTNELASKVDAKQIIINSMCPGFVSTNLDSNLPFFLKGLMKIIRGAIARKPAVGARAVTLCTITGPEGHGQYYSDGQAIPPAAWLRSEDGQKFQKKLWDETQQHLVQFDPTLPTV